MGVYKTESEAEGWRRKTNGKEGEKNLRVE